MTTGSRPAPFRVAVKFKGKEGLILPDQFRTLDRDRLIKKSGSVSASTLRNTLDVLRQMFAE